MPQHGQIPSWDTSLMPGYETNTSPLYALYSAPFIEDGDILHDVGPADLLAGHDDRDAALINDSEGGPPINVMPPTRGNTQYEREGQLPNSPQSQAVHDHQQSWTRTVIGAADFAAASIPIPSSSLTASQPRSESCFSGSGFASQNSCEKCGELYKNNSLRKKHILKHIKPFLCPTAGCKREREGFATQNDRERHIKSVHKEGLQIWWKCAYPDCSKTSKEHYFDRRDNFVAHIRRRHDLSKLGDIDGLVRRSENKPTTQELNRALHSKETRPQPRSSISRASFDRSARSPRLQMNKSIQITSAGSDTASAPSPLTPGDVQLPLMSWPSSAPEILQYFPSSHSSKDDFSFMGGGAETPAEQATSSPNSGRRHERPALLRSVQEPSYLSTSVPGEVFCSSFNDTVPRSQVWQGKQPTSAPQHTFPSISLDQVMAQRSLESMLSNPLYSASFLGMESGPGVTTQQAATGSSDPSVYVPITHSGAQVLSPYGSPDDSFGQGFSADMTASFHEASASSSFNDQGYMSPFNLALNFDFQDNNFDSSYSSSLFQDHEFVDEG